MEKVFVAQRVATKLFSTEAAVDQAMVEATELLADMLKARTDVNASLVFADDVQVKMMEALKALGEARTAMVGVHGDQGYLFQLGVALVPACGHIGREGTVSLPKNPQKKMFTHFMQLARKKRTGRAPFGHNGKAVKLHKILVHEHAVALINIAVAINKLAYANAKTLELAVYIRRKRGKYASQMKLLVCPPSQHVRPVHVQKIGHKPGMFQEQQCR